MVDTKNDGKNLFRIEYFWSRFIVTFKEDNERNLAEAQKHCENSIKLRKDWELSYQQLGESSFLKNWRMVFVCFCVSRTNI